MDKYSFDELKMMYESAEKVTDRRLSTNTTNYSICIGVIIAVSLIWKWTLDNPPYFFCGLLLVIVLTGIAIVFCALWIGQIRDLKNLNTAKFEVINEMAENVDFDSSHHDVNIKSFRAFDKEWKKLSEIKALQERNDNKIVALRSSNIEFFVPKSLRAIFILFFLLSIVTIIVNPSATANGIRFLLHLNN